MLFYGQILADNRRIAIFASSNNKYQYFYEVHRTAQEILKAGWTYDHAEGSHYFYVKDGVMTEGVPYHGAKEMGTGIANKLIRKYGV